MEQPKKKKPILAMAIGLLVGIIIGFTLMRYFMG